MKQTKYGNIYEVKLENGKYVYLCWIEELSFGVYDYYSDEPSNLEHILPLDFKLYAECKETAAKKKIWKKIGYIDLEKANIKLPDLAVFNNLFKENDLRLTQAMRHGRLIQIPKEEYMSLLKKGYLSGFFDDYRKLEKWLSMNMEGYPENQGILPELFE